MSRSIEEIQKFINDGTIMDNVMNDCKFKVENNKIQIIFPDWLNYLEDFSKDKIISNVQKHAPTVIENMYPNNKVLKTEVRTIQ